MELPKIKDSPLIYVLGGSLGTAVFLAAGLIIYSLPGASPIKIENVGYWTTPTTWRIDSHITATESCDASVFRGFARDGSAQREPIASYNGKRLGERPYLVSVPPGQHFVWYEYEATPGLDLQYLLEVDAWWCEGGFDERVGRWALPVGTPGVVK